MSKQILKKLERPIAMFLCLLLIAVPFLADYSAQAEVGDSSVQGNKLTFQINQGQRLNIEGSLPVGDVGDTFILSFHYDNPVGRTMVPPQNVSFSMQQQNSSWSMAPSGASPDNTQVLTPETFLTDVGAETRGYSEVIWDEENHKVGFKFQLRANPLDPSMGQNFRFYIKNFGEAFVASLYGFEIYNLTDDQNMENNLFPNGMLVDPYVANISASPSKVQAQEGSVFQFRLWGESLSLTPYTIEPEVPDEPDIPDEPEEPVTTEKQYGNKLNFTINRGQRLNIEGAVPVKDVGDTFILSFYYDNPVGRTMVPPQNVSFSMQQQNSSWSVSPSGAAPDNVQALTPETFLTDVGAETRGYSEVIWDEKNHKVGFKFQLRANPLDPSMGQNFRFYIKNFGDAFTASIYDIEIYNLTDDPNMKNNLFANGLLVDPYVANIGAYPSKLQVEENSVFQIRLWGETLSVTPHAPAEALGAQVRDVDANGNTALRFGYTLNATGVTYANGNPQASNNYARDLTNATVTILGEDYTLVDFGAVVSLNADDALTLDSAQDSADGSTQKVSAVKLYDVSEDGKVTYTAVITNIPANHVSTNFYARSYVTYSNGSENITIYGSANSRSVNDCTADIIG